VLLGETERTPTYHGSGLGLWLVNLLVTRSGGRVDHEPREPQGNVVRVTLPR
jgi:signal transduction histidine kinase